MIYICHASIYKKYTILKNIFLEIITKSKWFIELIKLAQFYIY